MLKKGQNAGILPKWAQPKLRMNKERKSIEEKKRELKN